MACVFPGAPTLEGFWQDVLAGRRAFRLCPDERLPLDWYYDSDPEAYCRTYAKQMAVVNGWTFRPEEFRVPPITEETTDRAQWLALWTARAAFEDAGLDLERLDRSRVRVVLGNSLGGEDSRSTYLRFRWPHLERGLRRALAGVTNLDLDSTLEVFHREVISPLAPITEDTLAGALSSTIAGRVCNHFDIHGGGYTVDGACSSSLVSVAAACDALVAGDVDVVLAGGVDISLGPLEMVGFAKTLALARDDIRPYDERAAGTLLGEGCGLLVLARENEARKRSWPVRALICGWGVSSDGHGGMTAPRRQGQRHALHRAYARAGYPLSSVSLLEGHGTGTTLGDRVEIGALTDELGEDPAAACMLGSVKGNIGHCKAAAGAAGLIKAVLALERKVLPPTVGCARPNRAFEEAKGRLVPALEGRAWTGNPQPRRAGVSAFGFGGSNAHVTVEEAPGSDSPAEPDLKLLASAQSVELVALSAVDGSALARRLRSIADEAARCSRAELTDLAAELCQRDAGEPYRLAVVAHSPWELAEILGTAAARLEANGSLEQVADARRGIYAGIAGESAAGWVALFAGQGSQRPGMGRAFSRRYPFLRELYQRFDEAVADVLPEGVWTWTDRAPALVPEAVQTEWARCLRDTRRAQPTLAAMSLACLEVLRFHGLEPAVCLGHSLGEITALAAAGALSASDGVRVAALRGAAIADLELEDPGAMASVLAPPGEVRQLIDEVGVDLRITGRNSIRQTTVGGSAPTVSRFVAQCRQLGRRARLLQVSHAFHTERLIPAAESFRKAIADVRFAAPQSPLVSSYTGAPLSPEADVVDLLCRQLVEPIRFTEAVLAVQQESPALWLDVGPDATLTGLVAETLAGQPAACASAEGPGDAFEHLYCALAQAWVLGFPVRLDRAFAHRFFRPFALGSGDRELFTSPCERPPGETPSPVAATPAVDERDGLLTAAIDWIGRRTGYSRTGIEPQMRLRYDLGLDSIKVVELVQVLSAAAGGRAVPAGRWEELTLEALVAAVAEAAEGDGALPDAPASAGLHAGGDWVRSFQLAPVAAPLEAEEVSPLPFPPVVLLVGPRAETEGVVEELVAAGYAPTALELDEFIDGGTDLAGVAALVWWHPPSRSGWRRQLAQLRDFARRALGLPLGDEAAPVAPAAHRPSRWLVLRHDPEPLRLRARDAGSAFLASVAHETAVEVRWLRLPASWSPRRSGRAAAAELARHGRHLAYAYDPAGRRFADAGHLPAAPAAGLSLGPEDVVVVSGGARGVTSELAIALGRRTRCRLALLGRSSPSSGAVRDTLQRCAREGIEARYTPCDVARRNSVEEAARGVAESLGAATVVLHGAGTTRLRPFPQLTLEEAEHLAAVKINGLANLLAAFPSLRGIHVVSSVIGSTGMARQADYAFANAWMEGVVCELEARRPGLHARALGYTVWRDLGLGVELGSVAALAALGVTPLDTRTATDAYLAEVEGRGAGTRVAICGRLTARQERLLFPSPPPIRSRFLERIERWIPGTELVAGAALSWSRDAYLADHVYEGTPMLPAVLGIDAMVAAARLVLTGSEDRPSQEWTEQLRHLHLRRPVVVSRSGTTRVRILALRDERGDRRVRIALRSHADERWSTFFVGDYELVPAEASAGPPAIDPAGLPAPVAMKPDLAARLFQGPRFRHLVALRELTPGRSCLGEVRVKELPPLLPEDGDRFATPYPAARDSFLQTVLLIGADRRLPSAVGRVQLPRRTVAGPRVLCRSRITRDDSDRQLFDIDVFSSDGEPIEFLHEVEMREVGKRRPTVGWPEIESFLIDLGSGHSLAVVGEGDPPEPPRLAAARAAVARAGGSASLPGFRLHHDEEGRPSLIWDSPAAGLEELAIALAEAGGATAALVGPSPLGVSLCEVRDRRPDEWRSLLRPDGHALALALCSRLGERLDLAAARAWSVLEAGRRALGHRPDLGSLEIEDGPLGPGLLDLTAGVRYYSIAVEAAGSAVPTAIALAIAARRPVRPLAPAAAGHSPHR